MAEEWRQEGVGPHKTLAGNMFDPRIEADGQKGGEGVGGTSSQRVREEGREHIKQTYSAGGDNSSSGMSTAGLPPPSNTTDASGGLPSGAGGVARTDELPGGAAGPHGGATSNLSQFNELSGEQQQQRSGSNFPGRDPAAHSTEAAPAPADSDPTTGAPPTESGGDPGTAAPERGMTTSGADDAEHETPEETLEKSDKPAPPGGTPSGKLDNPSAIPSAGGEKLGEKHWGESKVVPDKGFPRASDAGLGGDKGVSSESGQPDKNTSDNTAKNTGGATGGAAGGAAGGASDGPQHTKNEEGGGEEKMGMMDKIKAKMGK